MRLDKFLKVSRLIKRRTVAQQASDSGKITINGKVAKPGTKLKEGDHITIDFGNNPLHVRVLKLSEHALKEDADTMYEVIEG